MLCYFYNSYWGTTPANRENATVRSADDIITVLMGEKRTVTLAGSTNGYRRWEVGGIIISKTMAS